MFHFSDSALISLPRILYIQKMPQIALSMHPSHPVAVSIYMYGNKFGKFFVKKREKERKKKLGTHTRLSSGISIPLNPIFVSTSSFMLVEVTQSSSIWHGHAVQPKQFCCTSLDRLHLHIHIKHTHTIFSHTPQNALLTSILAILQRWTVRCMRPIYVKKNNNTYRYKEVECFHVRLGTMRATHQRTSCCIVLRNMIFHEFMTDIRTLMN